jgi:DNA-binding CsgD family transcriptional regulator
MRQVLSPVLVGRDAELQVLRDALGSTADGVGGTFFVVGEAGVGKSRLAREVSRLARSAGLPVLYGRAVSGGVPVAYRPLAEAVMDGLRQHGEPDLPQLKAFRPALGRIVPEWQPPELVPGTESPVVLGEGLLRLLSALGDSRGCLLVLEDLQWADEESLAVLEYIADHVGGEPIICVATLRAEEDSSGRELMRRLVDRRAARVVELARLDDGAATVLARACLNTPELPEPVVAFLNTYAEGLPFLVEELLAGLVGSGVLVEQDGRWSIAGPLDGRMPPTFAEAIARRLYGLSQQARDVLYAAAVLGRSFDWPLLPAVTGLTETEVVNALRQAVAAQLVTADANGFRFRHALTRDAVVGDLIPPERARVAGRALDAVERAHPDLPGGWCELAADLADASGDHQRSADLLLEAGRRAMMAGGLTTAEATLKRARRLVRDDTPSAVQIDAALTDVLALAGHVDQAFDLGDRLLARLDSASRPPSAVAELHLRLARAAVAAGRWAVAADHLAATRGNPIAGDPALLGRLEALDAQVALGLGRLTDAGRHAAAALVEAERAGLPAVACEALEVTGRVARQHSLEAAEAAFARGLAVATAHGLRYWRLRALHELGTVDQLRTESVERLQQARDLAAELGALALVATLDLQIAAGLNKQFRPDEGLAAALRSTEASRRLNLATLPMALVHQATAHAQQGHTHEMDACLAEALALAPHDLDVQGSAWGHCRATAALLAEDRAQALRQMTTGAEFLRRSPATIAPPFLGLRVLIMALDGDVDVARAEALRVRESTAIRHRIVANLLRYADAVLLGRAGQPGAAAAAHAAADAEMGTLVTWYRQYALRLTAEAALAHDWGAPVTWLREAAAYFAARDERAIAAACRALLRRAGAPVPRAGRGESVVPTSLRAVGVTSREADVAALVAEGLTNQQLAARLHLSPRTVEKHVASLLAKTGCRRRAQLAGYLARLSG